MKDQLLSAVAQNEDLPPLPEVLIKIDSAVRGDNYNLDYIANLILTDPALAGKVLKIANSAFYGGGRKKVTSISLAISRLGLNTIRQIVYSLELPRIFHKSSIIDGLDFWKHSLSVGLLSVLLSQWFNKPQELTEKAYIAGLMHDLGIIVFCHLIPDDYAAFIKNSSEKETPLNVMEYEVFGIDHAELGAAFIRTWWPVDEEILTSVEQHHSPSILNTDFDSLSGLVNVSNKVCNQEGAANGVLTYNDADTSDAWEVIGVTAENRQIILAELRSSVISAAYLIST